MHIVQTKWVLLFELLYLLLTIAVCVRVIWDTRSVSKTLAYLMLVIFVPVLGMAFYFSFGINYRKRKIYNKKLEIDRHFLKEFEGRRNENKQKILALRRSSILDNRKLIQLLSSQSAESSMVLPNSEIKLLNNGENLFPLMFDEIRKAQKHIHIEFYIYEDDAIGNQLKALLIQKASEGVEVRFIYDDFGSRSIRRTIVKELKSAGIQAFPFHKIRLIHLANRMNYRNHRKIVIVDGRTAFVGGINVSDKYINQPTSKRFWRDTHLMVKGYTALALQRVFLSDWNFCSNENIPVNTNYFPFKDMEGPESLYAQIVSSGPDSDLPNILYSVVQSINLAKQEVLLATPYYIPDTSLQEALVIASLSGIDVKLLVPKKGDSKVVNTATQSFFEDLLRAGVKIYLYEKGFVHSKVFVVDGQLASVGTANLDMRSFDLNFEVSALIYDEEIAKQVRNAFYDDLKDSSQIIYEQWQQRPKIRQVAEKVVRLVSPFM
ncbi:MAG TPA: cardiolipin synthase [Aquaticitalea sp.]|nr:cardiolipin synthase [Aquaticitalea sp.]